MQRERAGLAQRASIFAGFALLGAWHIARQQSPALAVGDLVLPLVLALALAAAARRGRRVLACACVLWVVSVAVLAPLSSSSALIATTR